MNIPTVDWQGFAEIERTELGPRVIFKSDDSNGLLLLTNLQTSELAEYISATKVVDLPMSARQVKVSHKGENVTISWTNGSGRSSCTFETKQLLLQIKPEVLPKYFKSLAAANKKATSKRKK